MLQLRPVVAPLPQPRPDDLLAVVVPTRLPIDRVGDGVRSAGHIPGPAFTHYLQAVGSAAVKQQSDGIAMQDSEIFAVYMRASCTTFSVGSDPQRWIDQLKAAFSVYENPVVERAFATGEGMEVGPYLGDSNLEILGDGATSPVRALQLLETAIARHSSGIIHAAPSTVVAWDSQNLTELRNGLTYTRRGTPIAVGPGYIDVVPEGADALGDAEQWAFASGPLEIQRGRIEIPASVLREILDRVFNDVEVVVERAYVFNWLARQDPDDDAHTQAGVLIDEAGVGGSSVATAPFAPTLTAADAGDGEVTLTWTAPSSTGGSAITAYKVHRGTVSGSETLLTTTGVTLTYIDSTAVNGTEYFYKVSAVNAVGESVKSNELSATPTGGELTVGGYVGHTDLIAQPVDGAEQYDGSTLVIGGPWTPQVSGVLGIGYLRTASPLPIDGSGSRSQPLRLCIYLGGTPGVGPTTTLIGVTDEVIVDETTPANAWLQFPGWTNFGGPPSVDVANTYWVGVWTGPNSGGRAYLTYNDDPAHEHVRGNASVPYSSSANPSVPSWGDGGSNRAYVAAFEVLV